MSVASPVLPASPIGRSAAATGSGSPVRSFSDVLVQTAERPVGRSEVGALPGRMLDSCRAIEEGRRRLDGLIAQACAGRSFRPGELLALQAEIYRLGEQVSLTGRLVEEGVGSLRRLWSLQV